MLDLGWLLSPFDKNAFIEEFWQKKPGVLAYNRARHFEGLFNKEEVEKIIEFSQPKPPSIRLVSASLNERAELPISANGRINIDQLRKYYLQGQTVVLNSVEDFNPSVAQLARSIETEMGARVQVNAYLTPPLAQGFRPHYDTHDVLVAQVQGEKVWKVYGSNSVCPLNEMIDGDPKFRESAAQPDEIRLRSGDLLYIPRGWIHEAVTEEAASLHLTIGLHPPLGKDLISAALEALVDRHPELREALPVGPLVASERRQEMETRFARLLELFIKHASAVEAAEAIDDQLLRRGRSGGDGHLFEDMESLRHLASGSRVERRTDLPCRVIQIDGGVGLQFLNGLIRGPQMFEEAMRFVAISRTPFAVSDLPGLQPDHQLVLASSLLTDGLCRMCDTN